MRRPSRILPLERLTLAQLYNVAQLIGSPCSGTKSLRIQGIEQALNDVHIKQPNGKGDSVYTRGLSLVSIDMGIRNLAYAHLHIPTINATAGRHKSDNRTDNEIDGRDAKASQVTTVSAWHRLSISSPDVTTSTSLGQNSGTETIPQLGKAVGESFEPIVYADHAYSFIKHIIDLHKPTHVLIERQRFRSGGGSAVQEWTIRVGVFEGMLYAVLRALLAEQDLPFTVVPMLPAQVNRYWFEQLQPLAPAGTKMPASKALKKLKIDLVGRLLSGNETSIENLVFSSEAMKTRDQFLSKWKGVRSNTISDGEKLSKLDDLSDCLLQGLAWLQWQQNRALVTQTGLEALNFE